MNPRTSLLLPFLAEDVFARVLHALALVGLGRAEPADLGRDLPDLLLVDAGDQDLGRLRRPDRDLQVLALQRRTIADAGDFQLLLVALGDAGDQVVHQRARRAPHRARAF